MLLIPELFLDRLSHSYQAIVSVTPTRLFHVNFLNDSPPSFFSGLEVLMHEGSHYWYWSKAWVTSFLSSSLSLSQSLRCVAGCSDLSAHSRLNYWTPFYVSSTSLLGPNMGVNWKHWTVLCCLCFINGRKTTKIIIIFYRIRWLKLLSKMLQNKHNFVGDW